MEDRKLHKLLLGIAGIYASYLILSIVAQKLYSHTYISSNPYLPPSKFQYPALISCIGALACAIAGKIIQKVKGDKPNPIPVHEQVLLSILYSANILSTSYSLLHLSYPVQTIGRNIRLLLVVIIGAFFSRVQNKHSHLKLGKHKILVAIIITGGVLLFNYGWHTNPDKSAHPRPQTQVTGYTLLIISVICDALFSDSQAYSKATFKPNANHLFTTINKYTFIFAGILSIIDGSFIPSFQFVLNYPSCIIDIILLVILQILGQISVYYIIANFKQHVFPLISTTRKIITVILSALVFNHSFSRLQWMSIVIVFLGMFYQLYEQISQKKVNNLNIEKKQEDRSQVKNVQEIDKISQKTD